MGCDVYDTSAAARAVFDQANQMLGFDVTRLCFEGPEETLTATENAQPAILTTSIALLAALAEQAQYEDVPSFVRLHAAFVAGHSLGEYTALVAGGALDLPTALQLVRQRGELMAAAHEGIMAAVIGMAEDTLEALCREASTPQAQVVIANYNAPGQLVISGAVAAVERVSALAKANGAKRVMPLKVSAAFHSPLLHEAADGLAPALHAAPIANAAVPVLANVTAEPLCAADAIRRELVMQVTAPVRWIASVQRMCTAGVDMFVEIGPGQVLTGVIKRIAADAKLVNVKDIASVQAFFAVA